MVMQRSEEAFSTIKMAAADVHDDYAIGTVSDKLDGIASRKEEPTTAVNACVDYYYFFYL